MIINTLILGYKVSWYIYKKGKRGDDKVLTQHVEGPRFSPSGIFSIRDQAGNDVRKLLLVGIDQDPQHAAWGPYGT